MVDARYRALILGVLLSTVAVADRITLGGVTHTDVYVRESDTLYYVQFPDTGKVEVAAKASVNPSDVVIDGDEAARAALLARWNAARTPKATPSPQLAPEPGAGEAQAPAASSERPGVPTLRLRGSDVERPASDGMVPDFRMDNVPAGVALQVMLRGQGLDYAVQENFLYISTPERLRQESFESIETRAYPFYDDAGTLPKIVLRQNFAGGGASYGSGSSFGGAGGSFGGGQTGGFGGQGLGNTARGGGNQGGFGNAGGYGGGNGGGDVTSISNISDMFSTIDDTLVGESPAYIGNSYSRR